MGKYIEKYSALLRDDQQRNTTRLPEDKNVVEPLARYREAKAKNQAFSVVFGLATPEGSLYGEDEYGVTIVLENEVLAKDLSYFTAYIKDRFMNVDFNVLVKDIDEKNNTVFVRSAHSDRGTTKAKLISEIIHDLNGGKKLIVPGTIISVSENRVLVNILGQGILGICRIKHWTNGFQRTLVNSIEVGEVYDFLIDSMLPKGKHATQAFALTRDTITEDPWKNLPDFIKEDTVIDVTCIEKPDGKTYWWGKSNFVKGIEIMCDYTENIGRPLIGAMYKCKIKKLSPVDHVFKVVPFALASKDPQTIAAVKFINRRRKSKAVV
ncbi:hypothetical protein [Butyrivibrio proteoclasticus]|uniref:hypothetical protein n=1 Tax=Butyrivibrio proteoclasticus TaxID=43305 RepID=UPI00047B2E7F|nr:hypothetical protein [Butyrivibrio proteoclasticus]